MKILVGGGVRCGKSSFALSRARALGTRRVYVATAEALDGEMTARISAHVRERGDAFRTLEAPIQVVDAVASVTDAEVLVLDCLTLWLSNLLLRGHSEAAMLAEVDRLAAALAAKPFHSIVVTNEVGMGVVPDSPLGRAFRDLSGRAHQVLAAAADEVYYGAMGLMLRLKPGPVAAVGPTEASR